ncbi:MAG: NADP-reducing hydrogenase subunit HndB [Clostridiales bacterium]|jgi:NADP-reducing hydrogenase subunit HndB|nr:(2Fe-2S) ferredoxin domain-containing protein [Eubacteriales bacterium]MDD3197360.1 (2Fe-2S) ferredoxin domain-containing protein [Eubacteriales bacterium]MDD3502914.1 (2Fe-2S) ferredoxin domain-containing protein [Eubacteriales bacterium]MDD4682315.1 (2Fe-2S) ferredoxin domain-containing protein [Eubacteriales bacterium]MDN5314606.1 NADP-reducing hydrogenase subunit HndB [Clostridiales bacterium]
MKSLAELEAIKQKAKADLAARTDGGRKVVVGMATCGIAAGARPVMNAMVEELRTRNINDIAVTMTGCIGVCRLEPIVEVIEENGDKVTYVKMDQAKARRVVVEHLINGQVCQDLTIGAVEAEAKKG